MRKIFILCIAAMMAVSAMAELAVLAPKVIIYKDMSKYKFVYIIPTSPITSNSGTSGYISGRAYGMYGGVHSGATKTVNPAEEICGQLVKRGYTILPEVDPDVAEETMIVAYGNIGRRDVTPFAYAVVLQFTDAETHEKLATIEAESYGETETVEIREAINQAFDVYDYGLSPYMKLKIEEATRSTLVLRLYNRTSNEVKKYTLRIRYYKKDKLIHEQYYTADTSILPGESEKVFIQRDKEARSGKSPIRISIESYE